MRQQPKGDALLACARRTLREAVLPALSGDQKHALLMALNAMSIAERQLQNGDGPEAEELAELRELLCDDRLDLADGHRALARLLRNGAGDPGEAKRTKMLAFLRSAAMRRLSESNPKALPVSAQ